MNNKIVNIGIIGKGYIGKSIYRYITINRINVKINFFSTSRFFNKNISYDERNIILKKKKKEIKIKLNKFITKCDLIINSFTIQQHEFKSLNKHEKELAFGFYRLYISIIIDEVFDRKKLFYHLSSLKASKSFPKSNDNYWYSRCHRFVENKIINKKDTANFLRLPNIYGFIPNLKRNGENLLFNQMIISLVNGKSFTLNDKSPVIRRIMFIENFCYVLFNNMLNYKRFSNFRKFSRQLKLDIKNMSICIDAHVFLQSIDNIVHETYNSKNKLTIFKVSKKITEKLLYK